MIAVEWRVERRQNPDRIRIIRTDDDAVRMHEVQNGRTLLEEFGIGGDREFNLRAAPRQLVAQRVRHTGMCPDGHGRLHHNEGFAGEARSDFACRPLHMTHIRRTVLVGRRAHCDHEHVGVRDGPIVVRRELQASGLTTALHHCAETRFVDRHLAAVQACNLLRVGVDAYDMVADIRQTCACHQSYISRTDDRELHGIPS